MELPKPPSFENFNVSAPVGSVVTYAGNVGKSNEQHQTNIEAFGWMVCDGRSLNVAQYPELFAALGYKYGGSGEEFNIPVSKNENPDFVDIIKFANNFA